MNMKKISAYLPAILVAVLAFQSCLGFLDKNPDLRTVIDSEQKVKDLLVSAYVTGSGCYQLVAELSSDNVCDHGQTKSYTQFYKDCYEWAEEVTRNNDSPHNIWDAHYACIAAANQALEAIDDLGGPDTKNLKASKGEALLARAYAHFILANIFCMPYNPETAANYPGLPYMEAPETQLKPHYERGTLKDFYDKIGKDIEEGLPLIDDTYYQVLKYHFNYKAACTFASRYYLFIQDWDNAIKYASLALTANPSSQMRDYSLVAAVPNGTARHQEYVRSSSVANYLLQAGVSANGTFSGWYSTGNRYGHYKFQGTYETVAPEKGAPWGSMTISVPYASHTGLKYVLPRAWYTFQYTDPVAGTGYSRCVSVLLSSEEALLNRAEAYIMKMAENGGDDNSAKALADMNLYAGNLASSGFVPMTEESLVDWATVKYPEYSKLYVGKTSATSPQTLNPKKQLFAAPYNRIPDESVKMSLLQSIIFMRRYQFLHEGMRWFDTRRFGITVYRYLLDEDDMTVVQITDQISDESGTADPRRALQLPADVVSAGLTPNAR